MVLLVEVVSIIDTTQKAWETYNQKDKSCMKIHSEKSMVRLKNTLIKVFFILKLFMFILWLVFT